MNEYELRKRMKKELLAYYDQFDFCLFFTGTYRQVLHDRTQHGLPVQDYLSIEKANQNTHHFLTRASRKIFGCAQAQRGKHLFGVGYVEGETRASVTGRQRIHNHILIGGPIEDRFDIFDNSHFDLLRALLTKEWASTRWGWNDVDVGVLCEQGSDGEPSSVRVKKCKNYIHKHYDHLQSQRMIMCLPKQIQND